MLTTSVDVCRVLVEEIITMIYMAPITLPTLPAEISLLAKILRAESFGALTHRQAIEQARSLLLARKVGA